MKIVGFEPGAVTVKLSAAECQALADTLARDAGPFVAASRPLTDAFRVCARVASTQNRQALTVRVTRAPLALARGSRSIVSVD